MLSFGKNQNVKIFSKGDGTQQDIWGVEVRRPFTFLKELTLLKITIVSMENFPGKYLCFSREIETLYN